MDITVRSVETGELPQFVRANELAFGSLATDEDVEVERAVSEPARSLAALDGDRIVGTCGAFSLTLTVPGGAVPLAGVTEVGVLPTHRRRGILTGGADLVLDAADLGAAYLGGTRFSALAQAGRVREETPGALDRAERLFAAHITPWCSNIF